MQRETFLSILFIFVLVMISWCIIAYSFYDIQLDKQKSFVTDGCTLFFDGEWGECCIAHDQYYWQGGSQQERQSTDKQLQACVYQVTDNQFLSFVIYGGARIGGTPYIKTPWRWGFGWEYGRGYR